MSFLYLNSIHCYLYSGVQIYITFVWGTARMLHDLQCRRTLRSLPILPIRRNLSALVTSFAPISSNSYLSHKHCIKPANMDESFSFKIPPLRRAAINIFLTPTHPTIPTQIIVIVTITSIPRLHGTRSAGNSQYRVISTETIMKLRNALFSK
jgi:hypothetical protein